MLIRAGSNRGDRAGLVEAFKNLAPASQRFISVIKPLAEVALECLPEKLQQLLADDSIKFFCVEGDLAIQLGRIADTITPDRPLAGGHLVKRNGHTSFDGIFGKFVRGLPYLAMAAAERAGLSGNALQAVRAPVGYIFEGYATWLARERFRGSPVRVIKNYRIKPEHLPKDHTDPERDLLLILGEIGFCVEVKAKVPPRSLRASGDLHMVAELVEGLSRQAVTAADALTKGSCSTEDGTHIPRLRKAYPVVLVFDHFPARFPFSDAFEAELENQLQRPLFRDGLDIGPLQVFDVDSYEDWDKAYRLPEETNLLFDALQERASAPWLRYESLAELRKQKDGIQPNWKSMMDKLCDESEELLCRTKT
ncbi:MAG: hypothetical protein U1G07_23450 [Verrucomicrobiota bacterium]